MPGKLYATVHVGGWIPLRDKLPEGDESVLLFYPYLYLDRDFPGHPVSVSNPDFARQNALKQGATHWCSIPHPMPLDVSAIKNWENFTGYQLEDDLRPPPKTRWTLKQRFRMWMHVLLS